MARPTSLDRSTSRKPDAHAQAAATEPRPLARGVLALLALVCASLVFASSADTKPGPSRPALTAHVSKYGRVLFDGRGFALYAFTADRKKRSTCTGACAAAWPPYLVKTAPRVGRGIDGTLLGTIRRVDGRRQLTYAGRPLYFYVGDRKPGQILCQGVSEFGGDWLVVRPSGALVR